MSVHGDSEAWRLDWYRKTDEAVRAVWRASAAAQMGSGEWEVKAYENTFEYAEQLLR